MQLAFLLSRKCLSLSQKIHCFVEEGDKVLKHKVQAKMRMKWIKILMSAGLCPLPPGVKGNNTPGCSAGFLRRSVMAVKSFPSVVFLLQGKAAVGREEKYEDAQLYTNTRNIKHQRFLRPHKKIPKDLKLYY